MMTVSITSSHDNNHDDDDVNDDPFQKWPRVVLCDITRARHQQLLSAHHRQQFYRGRRHAIGRRPTASPACARRARSVKALLRVVGPCLVVYLGLCCRLGLCCWVLPWARVLPWAWVPPWAWVLSWAWAGLRRLRRHAAPRLEAPRHLRRGGARVLRVARKPNGQPRRCPLPLSLEGVSQMDSIPPGRLLTLVRPGNVLRMIRNLKRCAQACGCNITTPRYACNLAPGCISREPTFAAPKKGVPEKKGKRVSFGKA